MEKNNPPGGFNAAYKSTLRKMTIMFNREALLFHTHPLNLEFDIKTWTNGNKTRS